MGKTDFDFFTREHAEPGLPRRAASDRHRQADRQHGGKGNLARRQRDLGVDDQDAAARPQDASSAPSASPATSPSAKGGRRAAKGQGGGRGGQPGQERVPGQHEPRDPHADERHHRHDRAGPGHEPDPRAARVPDDGQGVGRVAAGVINDILDFSKIEAGKLDLEAVDFALRDAPRRHREDAGAAGAAEGAGAGLPRRRRTSRSGWSATPAGCGRSWSTWSATPSSSPSTARWSSTSQPETRTENGRACLHFAVQRHRHRHPPGTQQNDLRGVRAGR